MNRSEIKKENRKALKIYIPILLLSTAAGGVFGYFSNRIGVADAAEHLAGWAEDVLFTAAPLLLIGITIVTAFFSLQQYYTAKSLYASVDEDEDIEDGDDPYSRADATISRSVAVGSVGMVCGMMLMGIIISRVDEHVEVHRWLTLAAVLFFIAGFFLNTRMQQLQIDFVKQMSPHMKGSVYDIKFQKKWEESCDEAEKLVIYRAAYKAFRTANIACCIGWCLLILGAMVFHYGCLPGIIVSVIWLLMTVTYYREAMRLERSKINR